MCDPHAPRWWPDEPRFAPPSEEERLYIHDMTPGTDERHAPVFCGPLVCATCFRQYPSEDELTCPACGDVEEAA